MRVLTDVSPFLGLFTVPSCQFLFLKKVEEDADSKEKVVQKDQSPSKDKKEKPKEKETQRPKNCGICHVRQHETIA